MTTPFADRLRSLLPPVAYDPQAPKLSAVIEAEGEELQSVEDSDGVLADRMHPATAGGDISSWETEYALSPAPNDGIPTREQAVLAKMGELGGLSIPYFTRLAASIGYGITIDELSAFRCGVNHCGERLSGEDSVFVWQVTINSRPPNPNDVALQNLFQDLKPAWTQCVF